MYSSGRMQIADSTVMICQLPEEVQKIIEQDLIEYANKAGISLPYDDNGKLLGLNGRFCDIEEIYKDVM